MTVSVLDQLEALGVQVTPCGEDLVIRPASKVPPELKERLRAHKAEVLAVLKARPAARALCGSPTCAGCYEVEPGRRIHPPKASRDWLDWLERWQPKGKPQ